jgi:hypothetical protein
MGTHTQVSKQTFKKYYQLSLPPTFYWKKLQKAERQMANLRIAVEFFWSPGSMWNVI